MRRLFDPVVVDQVVATNPAATVRGHENDVWSASFNPSGRRIVTGSWDNTARVWDLLDVPPIGTTAEIIVRARWRLAQLAWEEAKVKAAAAQKKAKVGGSEAR